MRWWPPSILSPEFWGGYWLFVRRFFAFLIDWLIVSLPLMALAAFLFEQHIEVGPEGRWFGFAVLLFYLTIAKSELTGSRSLGMRVAGLKIVDATGKPISLARSFLRTGILLAPLIAIGSDLRAFALPQTAQGYTAFLFAAVVVGIGASQACLLLANWRTRRMLHDLLAGTFVVRKADAAISGPTWPGHRLAVASFMVFGAALPLVPIVWLDKSEPGRSLVFPVKLQRALADDRSLFLSGYNAESSVTYSAGGSTTSSHLQISVFVYGDKADLEAAINKVGKAVLVLAPDAMGYRALIIEASHGVDFGIASWGDSLVCWGTPQQWAEKRGECPISNAY